MLSLFKLANGGQPKVRESDPATTQRIKEATYLVKLISESEVAARKCDFYAGNVDDIQIKDFFTNEAKLLKNASHNMQQYYESITVE